MAKSPLPLEGFRVIDMTEVWAGPLATSLLGDMGAEVIRLESFPRVSQSRGAGGGAARAGGANPAGQLAGGPDAPRPWDRGSSYHMTNRNKLGITLNLADARGKELFFRLVSKSDGFVIGYSAGTISRMGIDYPVLREHNPELVMISMPGWGERGPYEGYATYGSGGDAWMGHQHLRNFPDLDLSQSTAAVHSDAANAVMVAFAMLTGLHHRRRTGKGQFIDLSQAETLIAHLPYPYMDWVMNNRVDQPLGNSDPDAAPMGCYHCSGEDAWAVIVVRTDEQWQALKQALGEPQWASDPRFDSAAGRIAARDEIDTHLAEWTSLLTPYQVFEQLKAVGVPAGPVYQADGPPNDAHLQERGFYRWVTHPLTGQYRRPGPLFDLKATPVQFRRHTNLLGEHNQEVLCGLLGVTEEEYDALIAANVVGTEYNPAFNVDPEDRA